MVSPRKSDFPGPCLPQWLHRERVLDQIVILFGCSLRKTITGPGRHHFIGPTKEPINASDAKPRISTSAPRKCSRQTPVLWASLCITTMLSPPFHELESQSHLTRGAHRIQSIYNLSLHFVCLYLYFLSPRNRSDCTGITQSKLCEIMRMSPFTSPLN